MRKLLWLRSPALLLAINLLCIATLSAIPVPWFEDFSSCAPPSLPQGWLSLETQESNSHASTQSNSNSYSPPSHLIFFEGTSEDYLVLALPPIDTGINLQQVSLKWMARSYLNGSELVPGTLENPSDPTSFQSFSAPIPIASGWNPYHLSLGLYQNSSTRRIAFRMGNTTLGGLLIDNMELVFNPDVDLELSQVQASDPYFAGSAQQYNALIVNQGGNTVAEFQCQLLDAEDNVLSEGVSGSIEPGQTQAFSFAHQIDSPGNYELSAKVLCDGDLNPVNDQCPPIVVRVMNPGTQLFQIPSAMQYHDKYPIDLYWKTSLCETLYLASELPAEDMLIHAVQYFSQMYTNSIGIKPIKIWMGHTDLPNLSEGWVPATQLQLVFDSVSDFPAGEHPCLFCFDQPFLYEAGANLAIMVFRPLDAVYYTSMDDFFFDNTDIYRTRIVRSDTAIYDPCNPPVSELVRARPATALWVSTPATAEDDPLAPALNALRVTPNPFQDQVSITWEQKQPESCELSIYNLKGQLQRHVQLQADSNLRQSFCWDGTDQQGQPLPSGIYLLKLKAGKHSQARKLIMMK